jgi:hypothetical protein
MTALRFENRTQAGRPAILLCERIKFELRASGSLDLFPRSMTSPLPLLPHSGRVERDPEPRGLGARERLGSRQRLRRFGNEGTLVSPVAGLRLAGFVSLLMTSPLPLPRHSGRVERDPEPRGLVARERLGSR